VPVLATLPTPVRMNHVSMVNVGVPRPDACPNVQQFSF
jgi:hypothetical protein